ncbi:MAG TPA: glutamine-hydrolyzing GMP synthase, partial [Asticcacaulis sp.]|nr:glutamine-hydrolyzing GMP synthase [Asticcacaulis sp.]
MASPHHETLLIIDFGSQVTQLIARRVRECGVYCEIHPFTKAADKIDSLRPKAVILSGSPHSVIDEGPRIDARLFEMGVPVFGICYGEQLMCELLGGKVEAGHDREFGRAEITVKGQSPIFKGLDPVETVWMSHGDRVTAIPEGFEVIATSEGAPYAAIADEKRKFYAVQFHPEVVHTKRGTDMIRNFLFEIAGFSGDWSMSAFREEMVAKIRAQVGTGKVICGLSGGVDSSVAAILIHEAIGEQLTCVFVDTGLLRKNEGEQVVSLFRNHYNIPLIHVQAQDKFLGALAGESDPEKKRKTIGKLFIEVFDEEAGKIDGAEFLAQGTLYPDV